MKKHFLILLVGCITIGAVMYISHDSSRPLPHDIALKVPNYPAHPDNLSVHAWLGIPDSALLAVSTIGFDVVNDLARVPGARTYSWPYQIPNQPWARYVGVEVDGRKYVSIFSCHADDVRRRFMAESVPTWRERLLFAIGYYRYVPIVGDVVCVFQLQTSVWSCFVRLTGLAALCLLAAGILTVTSRDAFGYASAIMLIIIATFVGFAVFAC